MQLVSLNISEPKPIMLNGKQVMTGIYKEPITERINLRQLTLDGDVQVDTSVHGGADQAIYLYPSEHYAYWREAIDRPDLAYGHFGENFTTTGILEDETYFGDVFQVGGAQIQVADFRVPCMKLETKTGIPGFIKTFKQAYRPGIYLRVLEEGPVGAGDRIERVARGDGLTVRQMCHLYYNKDAGDKATIDRALSNPAISGDIREWLEKRRT
jgi:MOSC domain-containing protein YiiM